VDYDNKIKAIEEEANDILQNKKFEQEQEFNTQIDKINNSIEFLKTAYNEEYQKYIRLDTIKKILTSKFNIKNFVMEKFRPYLNKQISNYISIFRVPATILFDENFELQLKGNDYDELSLKSLSAGEICKTSLAILLASMKVKREIFQNNEFMLMILDEVFVNIDKESLNEILSIMKKNFEDNYFIGIVQHNIDSELEANIIQIEKTNKEGSKVRLL
jgi:DNA repair exonuclease SbcCD ATPase subunit